MLNVQYSNEESSKGKRDVFKTNSLVISNGVRNLLKAKTSKGKRDVLVNQHL